MLHLFLFVPGCRGVLFFWLAGGSPYVKRDACFICFCLSLCVGGSNFVLLACGSPCSNVFICFLMLMPICVESISSNARAQVNLLVAVDCFCG